MYDCIRVSGIHRMTGVVVLLALALAGCGGGGGGGGIGVSSDTVGAGSTGSSSSTGTTSSGGSTGSGGSIGSGGGGSSAGTYTATAVVTSAGVPVPGVVVTLTGGSNVNTSSPTNIIGTKVTDQQGQAVFSGLTKGMNYCFTATRITGTSSQQVVACSNTGDTTILLKM